VLVGPERLLAEGLSFGVHGGVCGGSNLYPEWFVALFDAAQRGDADEVERCRAQIARLQEIYRISESGVAMLRGIKTTLSLREICSDLPAEPFEPYGAAERARIAAILESL